MSSAAAITRTLGADDVRELTRRVGEVHPDCGRGVLPERVREPRPRARSVGEALRAALPDTFVVTSSEVWPELPRVRARHDHGDVRVHVGPVMAGYLSGLEIQLRELGVAGPLEIMDSAGGVMSAAMAWRVAPCARWNRAAPPVSPRPAWSERLIGAPAVISFDMGGTTAKVGIVRDGKPAITYDFQVGGTGSFGGRVPGPASPSGPRPSTSPRSAPAAGASPGSTPEARPRGPRSAGAIPGPACYGRGAPSPR